MKTSRGIYTNINESDYKYEYLRHTFYFSSRVYLEKFKNNVEKYIKNQEEMLYNRYKIKLENSNIFFALSFYRSIEKRGLKVVNEKGENFKF